jgi:hypothetical protein
MLCKFKYDITRKANNNNNNNNNNKSVECFVYWRQTLIYLRNTTKYKYKMKVR